MTKSLAIPAVRARRRSVRARRALAAMSDPSITSEEIRAALQRVVASPDFPATERNRRFLIYVVEKTLAGRHEDVTGYKVATEAFGRAADFNPTTDPIVRIEAAKLRRDLETYYLKAGAVEVLQISLPRGGYIPLFERRKAESPAGQPVALDPRGLTIDVLHGSQGRLAHLHPSLRARLADRLARQTDLAVFAGPARQSDGGLLDSDAARELGRRNGTRFILSGDAHGDGETLLLTARLHDGATGRLMWSEDFAGTPQDLEESLVRRVVEQHRTLAEKLDGGSRSPDFPA
jgi:TolB-like protein